MRVKAVLNNDECLTDDTAEGADASVFTIAPTDNLRLRKTPMYPIPATQLAQDASASEHLAAGVQAATKTATVVSPCGLASRVFSPIDLIEPPKYHSGHQQHPPGRFGPGTIPGQRGREYHEDWRAAGKFVA